MRRRPGRAERQTAQIGGTGCNDHRKKGSLPTAPSYQLPGSDADGMTSSPSKILLYVHICFFSAAYERGPLCDQKAFDGLANLVLVMFSGNSGPGWTEVKPRRASSH